MVDRFYLVSDLLHLKRTFRSLCFFVVVARNWMVCLFVGMFVYYVSLDEWSKYIT